MTATLFASKEPIQLKVPDETDSLKLRCAYNENVVDLFRTTGWGWGGGGVNFPYILLNEIEMMLLQLAKQSSRK